MADTLPTTMRFIDHPKPGGADVLVLAAGPVPRPAAGEVLVRVQAAGVNRPDLLQREGKYPPPADASPVLGLEIAGQVAAVGADVRDWREGDQVCALANGGGYAEYCAVPAGQCLPWPAGYDATAAAALPETTFTVWANLFGLGRLQPGETALVHGGGGGIGTTAIQLAKAFGARVYATAGSAERCDACVRLGADGAINYRETDFAESIRQFTTGQGVDVVLDMVGGPYLARNLACLAMDGRLVLIGFQGGPVAESLDCTAIMRRRLTVTGSTMRARSPAQKAAIAAELREKVWPLLDAGQCRPPVHAVLPLEQAADAHRLMESGAHVGKIVLTVAD